MILNIISFFLCKAFKMKPYTSHLIICLVQNIIQSFSFIFVGEELLSVKAFVIWNICCCLIPLFNWFIRDSDEEIEDQNNMKFSAHTFPYYFPIIKSKPEPISELSKKIKRDETLFPIPQVLMDVGPDRSVHFVPGYNYYETRGMDESYKLPLEYHSYQENGEAPQLDENEAGPVAYICQRKVTLINLKNDINDLKKNIKKAYVGVAALNYNTSFSVFETKGRNFVIAYGDNNSFSKFKAYFYKYLAFFFLMMGTPLFFEVFCHFTLKTLIFQSDKVYSGTTDLKNIRTKSVEAEMNEKKNKQKKE